MSGVSESCLSGDSFVCYSHKADMTASEQISSERWFKKDIVYAGSAAWYRTDIEFASFAYSMFQP